MELVSTIIPAYNSEKLIVRAIDSVISQTYQNIEIVMVDDGSTDQTADVARQKLRKNFIGRWQVIELGVNRGVSAARNAALRAVHGSWIQSLDADDFLAPTKFEKQMDVCVDAPSDIAAVYLPWRQAIVDGERIEWMAPLEVPDVNDKPPIMVLASNCHIIHQASLIRRSALEKSGGFDEALRIYECEDMLVRLNTRGGRFKLEQSNEPFYFWCQHRDRPQLGRENSKYRVEHIALGWIDMALKVAGNRSVDALGLSTQDRRLLQHDATKWARRLYLEHREEFVEYMAKLRVLFPKFNPTNPWYLSALSRCVGYENAEEFAKLVRAPKRTILAALRKA